MSQQLAEWLAQFGIGRSQLYVAAVILLLLAAAIKAARTVVARRRRKERQGTLDPALNLALLPQDPPPATGPRLEFYNLPVRLSGVVVAPAGRGSDVPVADAILWHVLENVVPNVSHVARAQGPKVIHWPAQLSGSGFAHAVFREFRVARPEFEGKRTVWSVVAGHVAAGEQTLAVALILRADAPNAFGQEIVEHEGDWRRMFRVVLA